MPAFDDDPSLRPAPKIAHEVGQDLATLSVDELRARVAVLEAEIARLTREIEAKSVHRSAADLLFKR